jgi:CHASE2 domain-containing sensor protein
VVAAATVVAANLISVALSPVRSVSVWGLDPGQDTYGLASVASHAVIFAAMATHLRTPAQLTRLLWAIAGAAIAASAYGTLQHFGVDPLRPSSAGAGRASLTLGNPIFAGAFLAMTIPLSLGLVHTLRERMGPARHIALGTAILAPQLAGLFFTYSRGPWARRWRWARSRLSR